MLKLCTIKHQHLTQLFHNITIARYLELRNQEIKMLICYTYHITVTAYIEPPLEVWCLSGGTTHALMGILNEAETPIVLVWKTENFRENAERQLPANYKRKTQFGFICGMWVGMASAFTPFPLPASYLLYHHHLRYQITENEL